MAYQFYFEKLEIWRLAVSLAKEIYEITSQFPAEEKFGLMAQMRRAAVSVSSNIAEGSTRKSSLDKSKFMGIAFGSLLEVLSQAIVALELEFISKEELSRLRAKIDELANKIIAFRNALKRNNYGPWLEEPEAEFGTSDDDNQFYDLTILQFNEPPYFAHETAVIDPGAAIGKGTKIWHFCHVMPGAVIGQNCSLGQNVFVANGVRLGNNVKVQNNVSIYEGVTCEDDVFLGPSMVFTNVINPRSAVNRKAEYLPTLVKKGATIGANATIVCGITIGAYAFIGAGAVVIRDVPDYALVVGNPARRIGWMSQAGQRLEFDEKGFATCPQTGVGYRLEGENKCTIVLADPKPQP